MAGTAFSATLRTGVDHGEMGAASTARSRTAHRELSSMEPDSTSSAGPTRPRPARASSGEPGSSTGSGRHVRTSPPWSPPWATARRRCSSNGQSAMSAVHLAAPRSAGRSGRTAEPDRNCSQFRVFAATGCRGRRRRPARRRPAAALAELLRPARVGGMVVLSGRTEPHHPHLSIPRLRASGSCSNSVRATLPLPAARSGRWRGRWVSRWRKRSSLSWSKRPRAGPRPSGSRCLRLGTRACRAHAWRS